MVTNMVIFIGLLATLATSVSATEFIVGDEYGWTLNFDYQAWANGKEFVVGDKLVFKYPVGKHNVFKVDGNGFKECVVPASNESLATGYDVVTLSTPGKKWYICGVGKHCETGGMKLVIDVLPWLPIPPMPAPAPAPAFAPGLLPSGKVFIVGDDYGWTLNFDYQAWAKGKEFFVGDKLVFKYPVGKHNVFKVDGNGFKECVIPASNESLATGYDVVTLTTPGKKWYICGVGKHCETGGMKLVINVLSWLPIPPMPAPISAPAPALGPIPSGKVFIVGDDYGWTLNFDYQSWAKGKEFFVGDKLVFKYPVGKHNVFKVDGNGFKECVVPTANESLATGYDVVTLTTPGKKWYICGVGKHCETGGMKLVINVLSWLPIPPMPAPISAPAPALGPIPSGKVFIVGDDYGWTLNFDYQAWAKGKEFFVGDKLVFKYPVGKHNVFKVDGNGFKECVVPTANESLASGYDVVTLTTPGKKWYICGVGKHCETGGMKLVINVLASWLPIPPMPAPVSAPALEPVPIGKVFIVGDDYGWTLNFDYQAWAKGKEFVVGDQLVFKYPTGTHNVYKVNGTDFQQCTIPVSSVPLSSGYDVVTLATPGRKWYICGVGKHCKTGGMKLVIDVLPQSTYPPSPSPWGNKARRLGNNRVRGLVA